MALKKFPSKPPKSKSSAAGKPKPTAASKLKAKAEAALSAIRRTRAAVAPRASVTRPEDTNPFVQPLERFIPSFEGNGSGAPSQAPQAAERWSGLPENYGDNLIHLLVRDPHMLFSYWEIQRDHEARCLQKLGSSWDGVRSVLRVYITSEKNGKAFFDITLQGLARDWYIAAEPNKSYVIEIGLLHKDGRFVALARSNEVTTPRDGMSEVLDEEWMAIDFEKMYALSGGFQVGKSSAELQKLMSERLKGAITSGSGGMSPVRIREKARGFRFELDCELVVYGSTEPDAEVTVQGKAIKLRPDGTFTLRYALPDGRIVVDAAARSADGIETRTIIPIVERKTRRPDPVLKEALKEAAPSSGKTRG